MRVEDSENHSSGSIVQRKPRRIRQGILCVVQPSKDRKQDKANRLASAGGEVITKLQKGSFSEFRVRKPSLSFTNKAPSFRLDNRSGSEGLISLVGFF